MASLNFKSAATVSLEELAAAFTAAFAGYFYPQNVTGALLSRRVRLEQIDLQHSLLAYEGEEFVGFGLLGVRGAHGWCGGLGVVPQYRGRKLSGEVMAEFVEEARRCRLRRLKLEVLTRNVAAIRLYKNAGMEIERDLLILHREAAPSHSSVKLAEDAPGALLRHFTRLHTEQPAWQRDLPALLATDDARGFYLGDREKPQGYALTVTRTEGLTHLIDLAAVDETSAHALSAGLTQLEGALRVVNEPEESLFVKALLAHGFAEVERQHEMSCEL